MERPAPSGRYPSRALVRSDPRDQPANSGGAGPNVPPISVGPASSTNLPGNFVLHAQAWSGWPEAGVAPWDTPYLEPMGGGNGAWSGFGYGRQDAEGYLKRVSTVMTCVDLNSRQLASFPVYGTDRNRRPITLPAWSLSPEPTVYADWSEFMKSAVNSYQLAGEAVLFCTARASTGFPARFIVLDPMMITADEGRYYLGNEVDPLDPDDILVIKYQAVPGKRHERGIGPLLWVGRNLVSAAALERYASSIASHGVWALLKHPANLDRTQADDLKAGWMAAVAASPGAPAILSGGVEFESLTLSPKDMALLDLKTYDEQRIASAFGVPPFLVGLEQPGSMTYSNANSLFDFHWRATLRPMASSFAGAMSKWLLPRGQTIWFNRDEYVKPGLGERATAYSTLHGIVDEEGRPAITTDEVRIAEGFAPYGGTGASMQVTPEDVAVLTGVA